MTDCGYKAIETIRVSVNDEFVTVTRYTDERFPPAWIHYHTLTPVVFVIDNGRGEPPARLFPPNA